MPKTVSETKTFFVRSFQRGGAEPKAQLFWYFSARPKSLVKIPIRPKDVRNTVKGRFDV